MKNKVRIILSFVLVLLVVLAPFIFKEKSTKHISDTDFIRATGNTNSRILARGDINMDGYEDAILENTTCGASCGTTLDIVLNEKNKKTILFEGITPNFEPEYQGSSALKSEILHASIENGIIYLTGLGLACDINTCTKEKWNTIRTLKYKLENNTLKLIK